MPITVLRHAHTDWNGPPKRFQGRTDIPLSATGRAAASALGKTLRRPDRVMCSPAQRCVETAKLLFGDIETTTDERLWEIDTGSWSGLTEEAVRLDHGPALEGWLLTPDRHPPGDGESVDELAARVCAAFDDLERHSGSADIVVVTHGGPIRTLYLAARGAPLSRYHDIEIDNLARFRFQNRPKPSFERL